MEGLAVKTVGDFDDISEGVLGLSVPVDRVCLDGAWNGFLAQLSVCVCSVGFMFDWV